MAKVTDGARSHLSGKADKLVYVQFNGEVYTRKLPKRKKEAWTPGMIQNLERFRQVNLFCALFKDSLIPQIWNGAAQKMSGYAFFLKSNMAAFGKDGTLEDARKISLSTGKLSFPEGFEAQRTEGNNHLIEVKWPKEMHVGGIHLRDELLAISSREGEYSDIWNTGIERNDLDGTFELPLLSNPATHLYLFFHSKDHRDYSKSVCFEM